MSCAVLPTPTIPVASFRFRKEFHCASKENNETVSDWYIRLKLLANTCQFGTEAEHFIFDKFVVGLGDNLFERLCMENGDLSLEQSIEIASHSEVASGGIGPRSEELKQIEEICDTRTTTQSFERKISHVSTPQNVDDGLRSLESRSVIEDPDCCVLEAGVLNSRNKINDRVKASTSATDTETPGLESKDRNNKPVNCKRAEGCSEYTSVDEKRFECSFCHRQWTHKGNLDRHIRIHLNEKPFTCHFCGKRFNTNSDLKKHLRTHTGERPFTCDFCAKSFTRSDKLKQHVDTHKGVKPHCCTICNKQFSQKCHLNTHIRIHTGERPFKCKICSKGFTTSSSLTGHLKFHQTAKIETT